MKNGLLKYYHKSTIQERHAQAVLAAFVMAIMTEVAALAETSTYEPVWSNYKCIQDIV